MPTLQLVRVHEPDAVREIIREAWSVALDESPSPSDVPVTFEKAADLLAARIPIAPQPMPTIGGGFAVPRR